MTTNLSTSEKWLSIQKNLGLAQNTITAYQRALREYLDFCLEIKVDPNSVTREHIALYINYLLKKPKRLNLLNNTDTHSFGLSNATIQQRITVTRLYYDFLMEEGVLTNNPVGKGCYKSGNTINSVHGLLPRFKKLPWIPNEEEWAKILEVLKIEPLRNKLMLALAYDAALRREELVSLHISDLDPAHRTIRIRAENTKGRKTRIVPYSAPTSDLLIGYLKQRRLISSNREVLFVSESDRNRGKAITLWTWSKVVRNIAKSSGVLNLSTHTFRHLCLTDLARSGWELYEIATFAGHKSINTTLLYIHLSGRELSEKLAKATLYHRQRISQLLDETDNATYG